MLSIDFSKLSTRHPELSDSVRAIYEWIRSHPNQRFLDPARLRNELMGVDAKNLAAGIALLVSIGGLRQAVHVRDPHDHVFAVGGPFKDEHSIPQELKSQRFDAFAPDEGEKVIVYVPVTEVGAQS